MIKGDYYLDFTSGAVPDGKQGVGFASSSGNGEPHIETTAVFEEMFEERLASLYQSAHQSGKHQIEVKLSMKPVDSKVMSLFCFPFLSRNQLKKDARFEKKYLQFLGLLSESITSLAEAPIMNDLYSLYWRTGRLESTAICQVMIACDEIFWVKDVETGMIIQGHGDGVPRRVFHLVRMERVIEASPAPGRFPPVKMTPRNWQITDIDDLLDGNVMI